MTSTAEKQSQSQPNALFLGRDFLQRWFQRETDRTDFQETDNVFALTGPPGSGKTTKTQELLAPAVRCGLRIAVLAPTHQALKVQRLKANDNTDLVEEVAGRARGREIPIEFLTFAKAMGMRSQTYEDGKADDFKMVGPQ